MPPSASVSNGSDAVLRGIDRAAFVAAFVVRLRAAGVRVDLTAAADFVRALAVSSLADAFGSGGPRTRLYWTARIALVTDRNDLAAFDAMFEAVFSDALLSLDPHARRKALPASTEEDANVPMPAAAGEEEDGTGLPWATLPTVTGTSSEDDSELAFPLALASDSTALADTPFADFEPSDIRLLERAMADALRRWPRRTTRREGIDRNGQRVAMRQTTALARRTGWETINLVRHRPVAKLRRLVMLCDVSQSMQPYVTAYLHFMRSATLLADGEVFVFSTSLTRLTPTLRRATPEVAIAEATDKAVDRFGGTRIASNLRALLRSHHGNAVRGAVFVLASDGWDSEPPEDLAAQMARLKRRAHHVIWLNPRAAEPGFAPLVGAMAAALPYCDQFLPAHNVTALAEAVAVISAQR